jgi:uncharacterized repeat protein (TIGR03803 family)
MKIAMHDFLFPGRVASRTAWSRLAFPLIALLVVITPLTAPAQTFSVLHQFHGADGAFPLSPLYLAGDGKLYGTTYSGGLVQGVIYSLDTNGVGSVLHSFSANEGFNGVAGFVQDSAGNLYGATLISAFKLDPSGNLTLLHKFTGGADGITVYQSLILDAAGNLYGTAYYGGNPACTGGCGTVFKIAPNKKFTVLHTFTGGNDGANPYGSLVQDAAGNLYGTTFGGGAFGAGVVFKLDPAGGSTALHAFTAGADGGYPIGGLLLDASGNLYGTTAGGAINNNGVVFEIDASGAFTVLHTFTGNDGFESRAQLVQDAAGNLYGTTEKGGCCGAGTVFKLDPTNTLTTLHDFKGKGDGANPYEGVILDSAGTIYGTTFDGGVDGLGVVYKIAP